MWRIGFITGRASREIQSQLPAEVEVVYVPHTPNPASGFVHYAPKRDLIYLDWAVEDGLKVVVSGGVVQPDVERVTTGRSARRAPAAEGGGPAGAAAGAQAPAPARGASPAKG